MDSDNQTNGRPPVGKDDGAFKLHGQAQPISEPAQQLKSPSDLRTSEIRYRRLFEAARDGILILDAGSRKITDANPFMSELLGYSHPELLGKELWEIGLLKDEAVSREAFHTLRDQGFIRYEDLPLQTKTGHRRDVEFVSNVYQEDGQSVIQCNIRDITVRKRSEAALREAKEQLARHAADLERVVAERTKALRETIGELESFSYSVSHDLRAPLRAMQGFAQIVLSENAHQLDTNGLEYLGRIARSAARLDSLVRDVLNYTRLLHSAVPLGRVELDGLVHDIVQSCSDWRPPKVDLQVHSPLPAIMGHEGFLAQCISNLVSNAVKFVAPGTLPRVRIWAESAGSWIRLCFQDNGIGIALEDQARVFRMFERIHPATEYEGTGIGLTIARKAVERMGGQVGFESELGKGSRFWIELPSPPSLPPSPEDRPGGTP